MAWPALHLSCNRLRGFGAAVAGRAVPSVLGIALLAAVSCVAGASGEEQQDGRVTVPDDISELPSGEVERRLSGLIENGQQPGLSAPGTEPTAIPEPAPSIQDILDALNSGNGRGGAGEIIISVSPSISQGLDSPGLRIKTPPSNGLAIVLSATQVLYVPAPGARRQRLVRVRAHGRRHTGLLRGGRAAAACQRGPRQPGRRAMTVMCAIASRQERLQ